MKHSVYLTEVEKHIFRYLQFDINFQQRNSAFAQTEYVSKYRSYFDVRLPLYAFNVYNVCQHAK